MFYQSIELISEEYLRMVFKKELRWSEITKQLIFIIVILLYSSAQCLSALISALHGSRAPLSVEYAYFVLLF